MSVKLEFEKNWLDYASKKFCIHEALRERFLATGLPTQRDENWKYTSLEKLYSSGKWDFLNPVLGEGKEIDIESLIHADWKIKKTFSVANESLRSFDFNDGLGLAQSLIKAPFHFWKISENEGSRFVLIHESSSKLQEKTQVTQCQNHWVVEEGAKIAVLEIFSSEASSISCWDFNSSVIELSDGASLKHICVYLGTPQQNTLNRLHVKLSKNAVYESRVFSIRGKLSRHEATVLLQGEGSRVELIGSSLAQDGEFSDHPTVIEHIGHSTHSRQVYHHVIGSNGKTSFHGKVKVHAGAQNVSAEQSNPNLLLGDGVAYTRPQLEIDSDSVQCSHGATLTELDPDAVFYLRSRGIQELEVKQILAKAFALQGLESLRSDGFPELMNWIESNWEKSWRGA